MSAPGLPQPGNMKVSQTLRQQEVCHTVKVNQPFHAACASYMNTLTSRCENWNILKHFMPSMNVICSLWSEGGRLAPGWRDSESLPGTCFYFCGFYFCNLIFELVRRISTKFLFQTLFDKELPPSHSLQSHLISMLFSNRGYPKDDRINILSKIHFCGVLYVFFLGLKQ